MWPFKSKNIKSKKSKSDDSLYLDMLRIGEEARKKEAAFVADIINSQHKKEVKDAYCNGYGDAQAELFTAIRSNPAVYHKFIDTYGGMADLSIEKALAMMGADNVAVQE